VIDDQALNKTQSPNERRFLYQTKLAFIKADSVSTTD